MRKTHTTVQVAVTLMADPDARHWVASLSEAAGVLPGSLHHILSRMLSEGWLVDSWEDRPVDPVRQPRRYYALTGRGREVLTEMLESARTDPRFGAIPDLHGTDPSDEGY
ncbi:MAG: PadR family transcriptional regulator [Nocardioidaceae bacterium]|jgi:PadR family transcriptional regulator PadR|nr:PadR family transcriptional regulator [Nocardioidaceae bacterium]